MQTAKMLETKTGYRFKNPALLKTALTHSSFANEKRGEKIQSNERLEFLGDSILGAVVSDYLFRRCPLPEGELTRMRASIVCEGALGAAAAKIGLGEMVSLGRGEDSGGGRTRPSILADLFEAVVAAIYLDSDMDTVYEWVIKRLEKTMLAAGGGEADSKTRLQQILQARGIEKIEYRIVDEWGPDHDKGFCAEVCASGAPLGKGSGKSKREAEQSAAKAALEKEAGKNG